eukprot:m.28434 g.28434  ORF g.28434 m.28434 type:complete len:365 (-) comp11837_c0_seq1:55-1149(-)
MPLRKDWFEALFACKEPTYRAAVELFRLKTSPKGIVMSSRANNKDYVVGKFTTPSLNELEAEMTDYLGSLARPLTVSHIAIGDVLLEHSKPEYRYATFQAASQFNCLEFSHPKAVPEEGVTQYAYDFTQGPACSIACGPGTVYRNYFASVGTQQGQTRDAQLNNLDAALEALGNADRQYFAVTNGYTHATNASLERFNTDHPSQDEVDECMRALKIGVQADTQVTFTEREVVLDDPGQLVSQCYCSAISCGYTYGSTDAWKTVALAVQRCTYEATLWSALKNARDHAWEEGSGTVLLTKVGGGVFRNKMGWIADAIGRACVILRNSGLDVKVCHHRAIDEDFVAQVEKARQEWVERLIGTDLHD